MSKRYPLDRARAVAHHIVEILRPPCARIEIAGSIRRGASAVKDSEIVAVPRLSTNRLGEIEIDDDTALDVMLSDLERDGRLAPREPRRWGRRYKAAVAVKSAIPV